MLFLLQDGPAQTTGYMIAGYGVIFGMMALYWISVLVRRKNLDQDLKTLEEVDQSSQ